ncbi:MAG: DNA primase [Alphaproteobacteria bacterium]|jgi:DNA primase|nr:DNA primase [Alphaproteobacteria bacterium]
MPFPPAFLDELRSRLPVSQVVGRHVRLVRAGREHKACCPFHKEKTPSFTISDDKGFFHCFGCGAHGDVVGFVMRHDNLSFPEAVEALAAEAGLQVPAAAPVERERFAREKSLLELIEAATRVFEDTLAGPAGGAARAYLQSRGLDEEAMARFRLGLAPADSRALVRALAARGFDEEAMVTAGLAKRPEDGRPPYAFFRNRILFPVTDRRGRVVAFGGRLLEGDGPKYINSPDGPHFHKGRLLYNLARARQAASDGQTVLVVEGYMDVISLVRAGFEAAVAPLGTALTEEQIAELWRLAPVPVLCFDGDTAGVRAAWRAAERLLPHLKPDHSVRFAWLPAGEDPDSLVRRGGAAAMRRVLEGAQPLADMVWRQHVAGRPFDTPESRAGLKAALEAVAGRIADDGVRAHYRREFRLRLDAAFPWRPAARHPGGRNGNRGRGGVQGGRPPAGPVIGPALTLPRPRDDETLARERFLPCLLNHPWLFDEVAEQVAMLEIADPGLHALRQAVLGCLSANPDLDSGGLKSQLTEHGFTQTLDRILSDRIYTQAPFARESVDPEHVRASWREQWDLLQEHRDRQDRQPALKAMAGGPDGAGVAAMRTGRIETDGDGG